MMLMRINGLHLRNKPRQNGTWPAFQTYKLMQTINLYKAVNLQKDCCTMTSMATEPLRQLQWQVAMRTRKIHLGAVRKGLKP